MTKKFVLFFLIFWINLEASSISYSDFLHFTENKLVMKEQESLLQTLYNEFLDGLSPSHHPFLIAIGGSPGAGKTTFRKQFLDPHNVHVHDMDEVLIRLPGYQKDFAALGAIEAFERWWPTAREVADLLVRYAIHAKLNIYYDRTCGAEGSYQALLEAKKQGYHLQLIGLYLDKEIAKARALIRAQKKGRIVTEAIITEYGSRFSALWPYYLTFAHEAKLYLTSGDEPALIFSSEQGILDEKTYQAFLNEGEAFRSYFEKVLVIP